MWGLITIRPPLVSYPCRKPDGSLWPDYTERCAECPLKDTAGCIWAPTPSEIEKPRKHRKKCETKQEAAKRRTAKRREQGLNAVGKQLARTCWNCMHIRHILGSSRPVGYVCRFDPGSPTKTAGSMQNTYACGQRFRLRTYMDILTLSSEPQEVEHAIPELG